MIQNWAFANFLTKEYAKKDHVPKTVISMVISIFNYFLVLS